MFVSYQPAAAGRPSQYLWFNDKQGGYDNDARHQDNPSGEFRFRWLAHS